MPRIDYYRVLGVSRDISDEDIKKAYRKLVFEHHPDRNPHNSKADEKIREINSAYEVLGDPERRRTYDRLHWGEEPRAEAADPSQILEEMEKKLFDEGRKEVFAVLMNMVLRIKSELAIVRERTVAHQGYDTFKPPIVAARGAEVIEEFVTPEMDQRKQHLLEVAVQMMVSQSVVARGDEGGIRVLRGRLDDAFRKGRINGFVTALELLYERR
ncbi:MAG: DnaJ domain-containing protein [Nitrospira sp. CR1.2]|nr:DnaJ domain-containing protein [Nitrospira sp. CR1.2]